MQLAEHAIGVCSWCLGAETAAEVVTRVRGLSLRHVQLALLPYVEYSDGQLAELSRELSDGGVYLTAGMLGFPEEDYTSIATIQRTGGLVPDARWPDRLELAKRAARVAKALGLSMVSMHAGFVPCSSQPSYEAMVQRVRTVAGVFAEQGASLLLETGQETSHALLQFLNDISRDDVGVNFDPANMILYGAGNPVDALRVVGRHVKHVHIKDAIASKLPGTLWGQEVPFGKGEVRAMAFLETLRFGGYVGPLVVEREAGMEYKADIEHAVGVMEEILQPPADADSE